jgi:NADH dehydrogenase
MTDSATRRVLIIGGGFGGAACVKQKARVDGLCATLFDTIGFHQFQRLLYQMATAELTPSNTAFDLDEISLDTGNVEVRTDEVDFPSTPSASARAKG